MRFSSFEYCWNKFHDNFEEKRIRYREKMRMVQRSLVMEVIIEYVQRIKTRDHLRISTENRSDEPSTNSTACR